MANIYNYLFRFQFDLLLNKVIEFEPNPAEFENLKVQFKKKLDENNLEGVIKMIVNRF